MTTLVPVLGDQLSLNLSSLQAVDKSNAVVLITECQDEATYILHHQKKLVFVFSCMRHFAELLSSKGWQVEYHKLDDKRAPKSISQSIKAAQKRHQCERIVITEAAEYRLQQSLLDLQSAVKADMQILEDTRFICTHERFDQWAAGRKQLRMENFYRDMRVSTGLLMDSKQPEGGQWNFDKDNRKPATGSVTFHSPLKNTPDAITQECIELVNKKFGKHPGHTEDFWFATTAKDARKALSHFIKKSLPTFGDYQDAMLAGEPFLSHSVLSIYINIGLL
ncbi:MAG: cryptochrome/photolyase family protein, partial [Pseudomonadota bacterium]